MAVAEDGLFSWSAQNGLGRCCHGLHVAAYLHSLTKVAVKTRVLTVRDCDDLISGLCATPSTGCVRLHGRAATYRFLQAIARAEGAELRAERAADWTCDRLIYSA